MVRHKHLRDNALQKNQSSTLATFAFRLDVGNRRRHNIRFRVGGRCKRSMSRLVLDTVPLFIVDNQPVLAAVAGNLNSGASPAYRSVDEFIFEDV